MPLHAQTLTLLALILLATAAAASPPTDYRVTHLPHPPDGYIEVTGRNDRGALVGWQSPGEDGIQRGFVWRNGQFHYLNDRIDPATNMVEPASINNRWQIVGQYIDPVTQTFQGFWLDRTGMRAVAGPPGAIHVFLNRISDQELIWGASYDAEGVETQWLLENGHYTLLDPSFALADINSRGLMAGTQYVPDSGPHAALRRNGVVRLIGPAFSIASGLNDRGQVVGTMNTNGAHRAFVWQRRQLTPLPKLYEDQVYSHAFSINDEGLISGSTTINGPSGSLSVATFWADGQPIDVNSLIHPDDPYQPYVTLHHASIDARGVIFARGTDSRAPGLMYFILTPMPHSP